MAYDENIDEELRRILDQGSAEQSGQPTADLASMRSQLDAAPDTSGDLPKGTKVAFGEDLPVAAPPPSRVPIMPKVVDLSQQSPDDMELAAARVEDRQARSKEAMERGTRQLIAGLTRTEVVPSTPLPTDAVAQLYSRRKERAAKERQANQDALRGREAANNAARTQAYLDTTAAAGPRAERGLDLKEKELATREGLAKAKADENAQHFDETKRHNKATEGIGWTAATRAGEKADRDERRMDIKENALKPRPGWEPIDGSAPTFRDAQQAKTFDDATAAYGALQNHRKHAAEALEQFRNAKTPAEKDKALGLVNQQMANIASKLRVAEGLNSSDASNHAVDTMLSLQDGSIASFRNFVNEGRLDAILDSAIASAGTNLDTLGASNNIRRAKGGKSAGGPQMMKFPDGSVHEVSADKMELALRKGAVPNG